MAGRGETKSVANGELGFFCFVFYNMTQALTQTRLVGLEPNFGLFLVKQGVIELKMFFR